MIFKKLSEQKFCLELLEYYLRAQKLEENLHEFVVWLKWDEKGLFYLILKLCEAKMHFKITWKNSVKKAQEVHHKFSAKCSCYFDC